jgi:hypothetical protein
MERLATTTTTATDQVQAMRGQFRRLRVAELQVIEILAIGGDAVVVALSTMLWDWRAGLAAVIIYTVRVALLKRAHAQVREDIRMDGYRAGRLVGMFEEADALLKLHPRPSPRRDSVDSGDR